MIQVLPFSNNPKDLALGDCIGKKKLCLISEEIRYVLFIAKVLFQDCHLSDLQIATSLVRLLEEIQYYPDPETLIYYRKNMEGQQSWALSERSRASSISSLNSIGQVL